MIPEAVAVEPVKRPVMRWLAGFQVIRRLGWGVADQAVSSISNFAMGIFVARSLGAYSFGAFTVAYVTYSVILNASRGLATDPLLVRFSHAEPRVWRRVSRSASGMALTVGVAVGVACLVAAVFLPSPLSGAFAALSVGLPGLLLQDSWRFVFFSIGRGASALINDLVWTFLLIGSLWLFHDSLARHVGGCLLLFGLTATAAAVFGLFQSGVIPDPRQVGPWFRNHRDLSIRYTLENVSGSGASQIRAYALGAVRNLSAVGQVRAAEILMGPFLVVLMGISQVAVPEASRAHQRGRGKLLPFCLALGGVQAVGALIWALSVGVVLHLGLGELVLGDLWRPAAALLPPVALTVISACFTTAGAAGLRALGVARRSLRAQLIAAAIYLVGGVGGAVLSGAPGACWGGMAGTALGALVWWRELIAAIEEDRRVGTSSPRHSAADQKTMAPPTRIGDRRESNE